MWRTRVLVCVFLRGGALCCRRFSGSCPYPEGTSDTHRNPPFACGAHCGSRGTLSPHCDKKETKKHLKCSVSQAATHFQHILPLTTTYYHIPTQHPFPAQIQAPLHSKWHEACTGNTKTVVSCMTRTCQTDREWATALALWPLGKSELCAHREPDWTSDHCHCY